MKNKDIEDSQHYIIIIIFTVLLSVSTYFVASYFQSQYFSNTIIIGDLAAYYSYSPQIHSIYISQGFWSAFSAAMESYHFALKLLVALIVNPELLININFNVIFNVICSMIFLILLNIYAYKNTHSVIWTVISTVLIAALPNYLHYGFGLAANYADVSTSYLIGASIIALLLSEGKYKSWLIVYGLVTGLTVMNRYASIGLIAFIELPVLLFYFIDNYLKNKRLRIVFEKILYIVIPFLIVAGFYLIKMLYGFIYTQFYIYTIKAHVTHIFSPFNASLLNSISSFSILFGLRGLGLILLILISFFVYFRKNYTVNSKLFINLWLFISLPVLFTAIIRITEIWEYFLYLIPIYGIVFTYPVDLKEDYNDSILSSSINKFCAIALVSIFFVNISWNIYSIERQVSSQKIRTEFNELSEINESITLNIKNLIYNNYRTNKQLIPSFEVFINARNYNLSPIILNNLSYKENILVFWNESFSVWETGWERIYQSNDTNQLTKMILQKAIDSLDFVIIMDPSSQFNFKYTLFNQPNFKELNLLLEKKLFNALECDTINWKNEKLSHLNYLNSYSKDLHIFRNLKLFQKFKINNKTK